MAVGKIACQICSLDFTTVISFKKHLSSFKHKEKYIKVFPNDIFYQNRSSYIPWIFIMERHLRHCSYLGLSQMTLCFCSELHKSFFLCHICEQKFDVTAGVEHATNINHFLQYFDYTDPNAQSFLSFSPETTTVSPELNSMIEKEHKEVGSGQLQMLHMPETLFKQCQDEKYCQVIFLLHQNKALSDIFKEIYQQRILIPMYRDDPNRKHPLIGLQYIVECICTEHTHLRHYLCTLCRIQTPHSKIIKHLLSFHHVYCYLSNWHPNTVRERLYYKKSKSSAISGLTDFAKQSEELHGRKMIKRVNLWASEMLKVINDRFNSALSNLESIKGSLTPTVKPGKKLEPTVPGTSKKPTNVKQEATSEPVTSKKEDLIQDIKEEKEENTTEVSATPAEPSYSFHCQNCSENFATNALYFKHLSMCEHLKNFGINFGAVMNTQSGDSKPHFPTFTEPDILCVGVPLVVTILCHERSDEPLHLCFACETVFQMKEMTRHLNSEKHILQCLMYKDPWKLPFAWKTTMDFVSLKSLASKEEGEGERKIRILDVPPYLFPSDTPLSYSKVMETLGSYHSLLTNGVPQCETFSKLQDNETFPILGRNFLVKYGQTSSGWMFLCLLCAHPLSSVDFTGHVFSWEHVVAFLEKFHPGSLDLNNTNEEMLLDLAKQAAVIHPVSNAQEIEFDSSVCQMSNYSSRIRRLSIVKHSRGKGDLIPMITPRPKLLPRDQKQETTNADIKDIKNSEKPAEGSQSAEKEEFTKKSLQEITVLPTELVVKEENPSEPSQAKELKSVESSSTDCKPADTMNVTSKKERSPSDMDTSDSDNESLNPKQECLSNTVEKKKKSNVQNVDKAKLCCSSDPAAVYSGPCYGTVLKSFIQKKIRPAVIGLREIYECVCNDQAPIYLCTCCRLKFEEKNITGHLIEAWHYWSYLKKISEHQLPYGKSWEKDVAHLATHWERKEGCGQTLVVQMTPEEYNTFSIREYKDALLTVETCLAKARLAKMIMKKATNQEPSAASSKDKPPSPHENDVTKTVVPVIVSECSPSTSTTPTQSTSSVSKNGKSFSNAKDGLDNTDENASLKMPNTALAGAPKLCKPVCTFITNGPVIPAADSKIISTQDNAVEQIQYTTSANCLITGIPKTTKPVCKFLSSTTAARNISNPAMTHLEATFTPMLIDTGKESSTIPAPTLSNEAKAAPSQQDGSVLSDGVGKRKAESDPGSEPASIVAELGNARSSAKRTTSESSSSQTKFQSGAAAATSTLKHSDIQTKTSNKHLKLDINAASHVKQDDPELGNETPTPITPSSGSLTPMIKKSQSLHIGLDQLLKVRYKDGRLIYCLACYTKLEATNHMDTTAHQINCVKLKFPWWSSKPGEPDLSEMVALLHDDEMTTNALPKKVEVSLDVYKEIRSLPDDKAIERAMGLLKRKCSKKPCQRRPTVSTSVAPKSDIATSPNILVSPCNTTSPDLGKDSSHNSIPVKSNGQPIKPLPVSEKMAPSVSPAVHKPTSIVAPRVIKGSKLEGSSNLSRILEVKGIVVIGCCLVWECRVSKHPTFYLCESCSQTIPYDKMVAHMTDTSHHYKYLTRQYPQFMYWVEEELPQHFKSELTDYIADLVKEREESMDAQSVLLSEECYEWVLHAQFFDALNVVQRISEANKMTSLPVTIMPEQEAEPPEQLWSHPTSDSSNVHTDLTNQMEISTTDPEHECDADSCITDTESMHSPLTDFLNPQSPSFASLNSPKQPEEPPKEPDCSATDTNLSESPINKDQPEINACSGNCSPLSHDLPVIRPTVDSSETTSSATLEDTSTDTKADIQLCLPSNQEASTIGPNTLERDVAKPNDQIKEEYLLHSSTSSTVDHNANENPPPNPAVEDKDYQLLINLLKQIKKDRQVEKPTENQTSETCAAKSSQSFMGLSEVSQCVQINVEHTPKNDANSAAEGDKIVTKNEADLSGTFVSIENTAKPNFTINLAAALSDNQKETISEFTTQSQQLVQANDVESVKDSSVCSKISIEQNKIKLQEIKTENDLPDTEVSVLTPQLEIQLSQMENKYDIAAHSEIQQPQSSASQNGQELQIKADTQEASPKPPSSSCPLLMKYLQSDSEEMMLDTPVQAKQTQDQELQLQPQIQMAHNAPQQGQSLTERRPSNIDEVQLHNVQSQLQSQQSQQLQLPTQVAVQAISQTEQVHIISRITPRPHNTRSFRRDAALRLRDCDLRLRDADLRLNSVISNESFQGSPGPPVIPTALSSVTNNEVVATGEYGQIQTAYPSNAIYANTGALYGVPHGTAHPRHVYQQLQAQQFYTPVSPFLQNTQSPEVFEWLNPHSQLQPGPHSFPAWSNGAIGQTMDTSNPNAVLLNTFNNQSYSYNYNNGQQYNTVLMQSLYYSSSSGPTPTHSLFYPRRP